MHSSSLPRALLVPFPNTLLPFFPTTLVGMVVVQFTIYELSELLLFLGK